MDAQIDDAGLACDAGPLGTSAGPRLGASFRQVLDGTSIRSVSRFLSTRR